MEETTREVAAAEVLYGVTLSGEAEVETPGRMDCRVKAQYRQTPYLSEVPLCALPEATGGPGGGGAGRGNRPSGAYKWS